MPFLLHPYVSFYTTRGCPALCTFCMWPQTISGHAWRTRSTENVAREVKQALEYFPQMKEIFFDDDTFNIRKDRVMELCAKFKPLKFQLVFDGARAQRLRNREGHGGRRRAAVHRGLRVRRPADSEEHQEGRHRRRWAATS